MSSQLALSPSRQQPLQWASVIYLWTTLILAVVAAPLYIWLHGLTWQIAALFLITYCIANMSVTVGYHRYFSHRSYQVSPLMEWLMVIIGAMAFQGSVLNWSTDHRRHHRKVDTEDDPYNIHEGFWWAHFFWMMHKERPEFANQFPPDLTSNRAVMWQHRNYIWLATFMSFGIPFMIGWGLGTPWGALWVAGVARQVASQHSTFFINSLCHWFGGRPYNSDLTARDNFFLAFLTFGEGYHNYHHTFQYDYRNGVRWYQWDPTKWVIRAFAALGLADKLKRVPDQEILRARLANEERGFIQKGLDSERVRQLRERVEMAFHKVRGLQLEYRSAAEVRLADHLADARASREELRQRLRLARKELELAWQMWRGQAFPRPYASQWVSGL